MLSGPLPVAKLLGVGHTQKPAAWSGRSEICGEGPCYGLRHAKDEGGNGGELWQPHVTIVAMGNDFQRVTDPRYPST